MKITVVQPPYFMGDCPDENIALFLLDELAKAEKNSLIVLPEYSNAGGISDAESELKDFGKAVGAISADIDPHQKYMRTAGFGGCMIRNDDFINNGLRPDVFKH